MLRFAISAIQKSQRKNRHFFLPLCLGNTARHPHPQVLDPSAGKLNPPGGEKGVLVNTATPHMGVHEDREDFGKKEELKQHKFLQFKTGCCLSKKKMKKGYDK